MTPQELKNSILQLAIQGKLVEQRPEEGTAAELLEKIARHGTTKTTGTTRTKSRAAHRAPSVPSVSSVSVVPSVPDDEKPFDIPESWEWVRLGECSTYADKKEKVLPSEIRPDDWSLDLEDIEKDTGRIVEFRSAGDRRITGDKVVFRQGQILYSKLRPYLKKILVAPKDGICTPELVPFSTLGGIEVNYLVIVLKSPHVDFAINSVTYGVKMPRVGTDTMVNLPIPLPPLAEQKRIVAKIEELLPLIDRYEKAWSKLEDFNRRFPVDMQKSLLQMAIQGKLVDQRPEEGTGEELLEKILRDRTNGTHGTTRTKSRSAHRVSVVSSVPVVPPIPDDEKPFDIPESWVWVRLGDVCSSIADGDHQPPPQQDHGVPFLVISNVSSGELDFSRTRFVGEKYFDSLSDERKPSEGDLLVTVTGSYGIVVPIETSQQFCFQRHMALLKTTGLFNRFLIYFLQAPAVKSYFDNVATGSAQKTVGLTALRNTLIPLPPLAEQKRIVAKLEEILPLCERLK